MTYTPAAQPPRISTAARHRLHERRAAEERRSALLAEATDLLLPYVTTGQPVPAAVLAAFQAKEAEAKAVRIPEYL